jgi:hypothetical protein
MARPPVRTATTPGRCLRWPSGVGCQAGVLLTRLPLTGFELLVRMATRSIPGGEVYRPIAPVIAAAAVLSSAAIAQKPDADIEARQTVARDPVAGRRP